MIPPRPSRPAALAVGAALAVLLAGCGQQAASDPVSKTSDRQSGGLSSADSACRARWRDLGQSLEGRDRATEPSALAQRWTSVIATVDYYATSATASSCDDDLTTQRKAADALTAYGASLQRWDLEHQLAQVHDAASSYTAKKAGKGGRKPTPPRQVRRALATLTSAAPKATQEMAPGWQEAVTAEIGDQAAVRKVDDDLRFLSTDSPSYAAGQRALTVIRKATG